MMQKYVGKKVKTAVENPKTGETVFSDAAIVSQSYGTPVLKFSYGIDPSFNGRIIYPEIPADLQAKPSFSNSAATHFAAFCVNPVGLSIFKSSVVFETAKSA